MKKTVALLLIFSFSLLTFGQTTITTKLTDAHTSVEGTKVSLIPPKDFIKAANFLGFQQTNSGSSIMVINVPGPYSKVTPGFTKEGLLTQGVVASKIENIQLNNLPAIFVTAEQSAYGNTYTKFILAFGTEKETMLINGIYPKDRTELDEGMKKALMSVVYEPNKKVNPFDVVDFKIDTTGTGIIFAKSVANSMVFNRDGKLPSESKDQANLIVAKAFSKVTIIDKKQFALDRIKQLPIDIVKIISTKPITIDSISGYEIIADSKDKKTGTKEKAYQVLLFSDSIYYMLFASCEADFDNNLTLFQKLVKTFKRK